MTEIIGFILAIIIGIVLGLLGGGGSILTLPVLTYILHVDAKLATAYSLFIVGVTALVGSFRYAVTKQLDYKMAIIFGIPSIVAVFITRKYVFPAIPDPLMNISDFSISKSLFIMLLFAVIMLLASISMIRKQKPNSANCNSSGTEKKIKTLNIPFILAEGALVGVLTGLVGAGGGFLIIPALVLLAGLEMKIAIGTSLLIIAAKSLIGFLGDIGNQPIDWNFLLLFTLMAVLGIFIGTVLSKKVSGDKMKPAFGWFVLIMGVYIIANELWFKF